MYFKNRLLILLAFFGSFEVYASDRDCIRQPSNERAIQLCQVRIDQGSRNVDVYFRLAEALDDSGQFRAAEKVMRDNKSLLAKDKEYAVILGRIQNNIAETGITVTGSADQQSKVRQRVLKLKCVNKSGASALQACEDFRQKNTTDPEVNNRFNELVASLQPPGLTSSETEGELTQGGSTSIQLQEQQEQQEQQVAELTQQRLQQQEQQRAQQREQQRIAAASRRALVKSVQSTLNTLGFNAGIADGIDGTKTYRAIRDFYSTSGYGRVKPLGESLLADLQSYQEQLRQQNSVAVLQLELENNIGAAQSYFTQQQYDNAMRELDKAAALPLSQTKVNALREKIEFVVEKKSLIARFNETLNEARDLLKQREYRLAEDKIRVASTMDVDQTPALLLSSELQGTIRLSELQTQFDQTVERARDALDSGDPERAKQMIQGASMAGLNDSAALSLIARIDTAIEQKKRQPDPLTLARSLIEQSRYDEALVEVNKSVQSPGADTLRQAIEKSISAGGGISQNLSAEALASVQQNKKTMSRLRRYLSRQVPSAAGIIFEARHLQD